MRVALDVEGVLADTHGAVIEESDMITDEHMQQWGFPSDTHYEEFMSVSHRLWQDYNERIDPLEDDLLGPTRRMVDAGHTVDILTHRNGVDEGVKEWLARNGVHYDRFISTYDPKHAFDYDVYIDDKPELIETLGGHPSKAVFARSRPFNEGVGDDSDRVERVSSLTFVSNALEDPTIVDHLERLTDAARCGSCLREVTLMGNGYCGHCQ